MRFVLAFFACLPFVVWSQISIVSSDMPGAGDTIRTSTTVNFGNLDFEETGPDFEWDFSEMTPFFQEVDTFVSVSETPVFYQLFFFFTANLAQQEAEFDQFPEFQVTDSYRYYNNSSSSFEEVGFGVTLNGLPLPTLYDDADVIYDFPVELGNVDSSLSNYEFDIPVLGYYGGWKKRVNEVDGYGNVTTPYGTFEVIRMKTNVYQYDSLYIDSLGFGFPVYQEAIEYRWLAKEMGLPVVFVSDNGLVQSVSYLDSLRTLLPVNTSEFISEDIQVYPNPCVDQLTVKTSIQAGTAYRLEMYSMLGDRVFELDGIIQDPHIRMDFSSRKLRSGSYILKLHTPEIIVTRKISVR